MRGREAAATHSHAGPDPRMTYYYVDDRAQANGDHEVHSSGCRHLPALAHRVFLGNFGHCAEALREAGKVYPQANGCARCLRDCHRD